MKITQLQCDSSKKKYNFIDIVNIKICINLIHDLDYLFSKVLSFNKYYITLLLLQLSSVCSL